MLSPVFERNLKPLVPTNARTCVNVCFVVKVAPEPPSGWMSHLKILPPTIPLLLFGRPLGTLAHDLGVDLLQPFKFRDPLRQTEAADVSHADGLIKPVVRFAALEVEISLALTSVAEWPRSASSSLTAFSVTRIPRYYSESDSTRVATWITGLKRKLSPSLKCSPGCRGSRSVVPAQVAGGWGRAISLVGPAPIPVLRPRSSSQSPPKCIPLYSTTFSSFSTLLIPTVREGDFAPLTC